MRTMEQCVDTRPSDVRAILRAYRKHAFGLCSWPGCRHSYEGNGSFFCRAHADEAVQAVTKVQERATR